MVGVGKHWTPCPGSTQVGYLGLRLNIIILYVYFYVNLPSPVYKHAVESLHKTLRSNSSSCFCSAVRNKSSKFLPSAPFSFVKFTVFIEIVPDAFRVFVQRIQLAEFILSWRTGNAITIIKLIFCWRSFYSFGFKQNRGNEQLSKHENRDAWTILKPQLDVLTC